MKQGLVSIAKFLSEWDAIRFCDGHPSMTLFIHRELDGRYHVYDGDRAEFEKESKEIDAIARREVEMSLHSAGIIEDPDMDGGLLG